MGQAFFPVNLDKKEFIHPHEAGDGYKLLELKWTLKCMAILMSNSDDHPWSEAPMHGRWANDHVVLMGEYEWDNRESGNFAQINVSELTNWLKNV